MQTFLPYPSLQKSASCLDKRRLFKQTWECRSILRAIAHLSKGWRNHCITRMWTGSELTLWFFWDACWHACIKRQMTGMADPEEIIPYELFPESRTTPTWFNDKRVFSAYKSHLLAKDEKFYRRHGWTEPAISGYWAPDKNGVWKMYSTKKEMI